MHLLTHNCSVLSSTESQADSVIELHGKRCQTSNDSQFIGPWTVRETVMSPIFDFTLSRALQYLHLAAVFSLRALEFQQHVINRRLPLLHLGFLLSRPNLACEQKQAVRNERQRSQTLTVLSVTSPHWCYLVTLQNFFRVHWESNPGHATSSRIMPNHWTVWRWICVLYV